MRVGGEMFVCVSPFLLFFFCTLTYIIPGFSLQINYDLDILFTFANELNQKLLQVFSKLEEVEIFQCIQYI